ncbi:MAG: hypothetical protein RLY57_223 [Candidatus Parcubacteria bacterium]|jgi:signal transduction histidine kinase
MDILVNVKYCYDFLINQVPVSLILYSHIPTALVAILFGGYVWIRDRRIQSFTLFAVCLCFAAWCFLDLASWFAFLGSDKVMFSWSLVDLFALLFFFFSYYFLYTFTTNNDLPLWQKLLCLLALSPTIIWTFFGHNLTSFDANTCEAIEDELIAIYPYYVEGIFVVVSIFFSIFQYRKTTEKSKVLLSSIGIITFLFFFFSATLSVNLLVNYAAVESAYNYEIYGLFGMPILLIYLGYLIIKYKAFDIKVFTTQGIVATLITLVASQFFFAQSEAAIILTGVTLLLVIIFGRFLIRSVRNEIESRELIQSQKGQLEKANERLKVLDKQKTEFVSLASHQLRAPMTAIKGYITLILDGDYGELQEHMKEPLRRIYSSTQSLIQIVGDFLDVTRIELGTMKFTFSDFDFKDLVKDVVNELTPNIEGSKLEFKLETPDAAMPLRGDAAKIKQVMNNLIDNSVKYTKQGWVHAKVEQLGTKYRFSVQDTGVGISPEALPKLFAKFVRAENANDANVIGTGLGLYVAKQMIEKHNGRIWAESDGIGKGSTFFVEIEAGK